MKTVFAGLQQSTDDKGALCPLVVERKTRMTCFLAFLEPSSFLSKQNKESLFYVLNSHTSS